MSQRVSFDFTLPELSHALAIAAHDLYAFAMVLWFEEDRARQKLLDALLVGLELNYIARELNFSNRLSHNEFRQEFFALLYREAAQASITEQVAAKPLELPFYRLSLQERAAVFLKTRTAFAWEQIAEIVALDSVGEVRMLVEKAREKLLGRRPKLVDEELFS